MKKLPDISATTTQLPEMGRYGTIQIKRWMLFEYKLSGLSLLLFALIYQTRLSTKNQGWTAAELSEWFAKDVANIRHILADLVTKGYLRNENLHYSFIPQPRHRQARRLTPEEQTAQFQELIQQERVFE